MNIEKELNQSMQRVPAPSGFAERTVARVRMVGRRTPWTFRGISRIAAAVALLTVAGVSGYRYNEHRRGEEARDQLLVALQITAEKAEFARRAVQE